MQKIFLIITSVFILGACAAPKAQFTISGDPNAPAQIKLENQSTNADRYDWSIGELIKTDETSPIVDFPGAGNYLVTLKAYKGKKESVAYDRIEINGPEDCMVKIETEFGDMLVKLFNVTPEHQANFLKLADEGFYDDLLFHRVINGFMVQGGDPNSKNASSTTRLGAGGPGYTIPAEFVDTLVHVKGALAAARTGDQVNPQRRSSGSQFYLVHGRPVNEGQLKKTEAQGGFRYEEAQKNAYLEMGGAPFLDRNYTVFGQVIQGLEVIDKIAQTRTSRGDRPQKDVKMKISVVDYFPEVKKP